MKKLLILLASLLLVTGCSSNKTETTTTETKTEAPKTFVVSTWGLSQDVLEEKVFNPFATENNVELVLDTGKTDERYTRFSSDANSQVDVIELSESAAQKGFEAGLFEEIDYSKLTNADKLLDVLKPLVDAKKGPAYTVNSLVIVYNPEAVKMDIKSYSDIWDESLKSAVAIPDITTSFGPAMVYIAADYAQGDVFNDTKAFDALAQLKPNIVKSYAKSSDIANMFTNKEVAVALVGDFALPMILKDNPDLKVVFPSDVAYVNFNTININKNSANKELAYKYIDYRISAALQTITAAELNEAPTNKDVVLDEAASANLTYGEKAKNLKSIDVEKVTKALESWVEQWNKVVNQ